ncbi:putative peroxiredoxin [Bacillus sp. 3255]|nr:putative peroxiredoxin [Bacillus sp. 3255]
MPKTMDVIGLEKEHFVEGTEVGGAATFLDFAFDADVSLEEEPL